MSTRRLGGLLALVVAAVVGCSPFAQLTTRDPAPVAAAECGGCHVQIHAEWVDSAHAAAFRQPAFVRATSNHAHRDCLGCHAPTTVFTDATPVTRADHRDEGVNCVACHLDAHGKLAGPAPRTALVQPHPTAEAHPLYRDAAFCGRCHEGTYAEWQAARLPERPTCQGCHMPPVTRTLTQATDSFSRVLVAFEDRYAGRRHTFRMDAMEMDGPAATVAVTGREPAGDRVRVTLRLTSRVPHLVPTGDFGFREVRIEVVATRADGRRAGGRVVRLYKELGRVLRPGEPKAVTLEVDPAAVAVTVRLIRDRGAGGVTQELLRQALRLDAAARGPSPRRGSDDPRRPGADRPADGRPPGGGTDG